MNDYPPGQRSAAVLARDGAVATAPKARLALLNPGRFDEPSLDPASRALITGTIEFFEQKGRKRLWADDLGQRWYDDFLDFVGRHQVFADLLTPPDLGGPNARWDTFRNCHMNEVLSFYGLSYWYSWQVSILGLGPIWMSRNSEMQARAARALAAGGIFAFALSEKDTGADIAATAMSLRPRGDGSFLAKGFKHYIGNANAAALVSVFGRRSDSGDFVFFAADPRRPGYRLRGNLVASQSCVAALEIDDQPIAASEILSEGVDAWNSALNTVNFGKYNLGWAAIGVCEHAFHEALSHAAGRRLYGKPVTDFPHVSRMLVEAWARLTAMKAFAWRACDYLRAAAPGDRRYLLYNAVMKARVTTEGEKVIDLLWDVIAARGFEKDGYFRIAARDIRALPKLEGTVHVNLALIVRFLESWLLRPGDCPIVDRRTEATHDAFLFSQGDAGGLRDVRFHGWSVAFERRRHLPNVALLLEQLASLRELLSGAPLTPAQAHDLDLSLAIGSLFSVAVQAHLVLEATDLHELGDDALDQIFEVLVGDFSRCALELYGRRGLSARQAPLALRMVRRPACDAARFARVRDGEVLTLRDAYTMND
jgi:acyl-CoA dehydrogenase